MKKNIIARTVHARRTMIGMTVPELAAKTGMHQRTFERRMNNPEEMSLAETWRLEKALGLSRGELASL